VVSAGIVVVAAAGNETGVGVTTRRYPAAYDGVIGVGAAIVAPDGSVGVWDGSNVGPQVDVYAPTYVPAIVVPGKIDLGSGTSSATAVTSGVVALLLARDPGLTPASVERLLERTATPFPARAYHIDQLGTVVKGAPIPGDPTTRLIDAGALLKAAGTGG
jgi:subtilisin family serine protease